MAGLVYRAGEGEALFGGRIVIKAPFEQLCITESHFDSARPGADPHIHRRHADCFDRFDSRVGGGLSGSNAILLDAGEGGRLDGHDCISTIKIGREEVSLIEFELESGFEGPEARAPSWRRRRGSSTHSWGGPGRSRLLNVHAPSTGFHERLRASS